MRYIDADELKDFISRYGGGATVEDCIKWIEQTDAADVRENVRGEWHDGDCSHCGWSWRDIAHDSDLHNGLQSNFCPNCGADMRREDNGRDEENHNRV